MLSSHERVFVMGVSIRRVVPLASLFVLSLVALASAAELGAKDPGVPAETATPAPTNCRERLGKGFVVARGAGAVTVAAIPYPHFESGMFGKDPAAHRTLVQPLCRALGKRWSVAKNSFDTDVFARLLVDGTDELRAALDDCPVSTRAISYNCAPCKPPGPCPCMEMHVADWVLCERPSERASPTGTRVPAPAIEGSWAVTASRVASVNLVQPCYSGVDAFFFRNLGEGQIELRRTLPSSPSGVAHEPAHERATGVWEGATLRLTGSHVPYRPGSAPETPVAYELVFDAQSGNLVGIRNGAAFRLAPARIEHSAACGPAPP